MYKNRFLSLLYFLKHFLVISLFCNSVAVASVLPVVVDGSTDTVVGAAANGVPLVDIAAPNSSGLSHNRYSDYNVGSAGLLLNNFAGSGSTSVTQTSLGGLVTGNPNFGVDGDSALVILNEVTSNKVTRLEGYTEIAGSAADLIVANPNGIRVNDGGFINVSRFTGVVGSSDSLNPKIDDLNFSLSQYNNEKIRELQQSGSLPELVISGSGLNVENVSNTDLIAGVMRIIAPIHGGDNNLSFRSGDKVFNYLTKEINSYSKEEIAKFDEDSKYTKSSISSASLVEEIAIDASVLSNIQAGNIFLIATKEGVGVKFHADTFATLSGVSLDVDGNIVYGNAKANNGDINIKSHLGTVTNLVDSVTLAENGDIIIEAGGDIINQGQLLSDSDVRILNKHAIFYNNKDIVANNDITITSFGLVNEGKVFAGENINLNNVDINNSGTIEANDNLAIKNFFNSTAYKLNNKDGELKANKLLDINLGDMADYIIEGVVQSADEIKIYAKNIINKTAIKANGDIEITAAGYFSNSDDEFGKSDDTLIATNNNLFIEAKNIIKNYSTLSTKGDLKLTSLASDIINYAKAEIITKNLFNQALKGDIFQNSKNSVIVDKDYTINADNYINTGRIDINGILTMNILNDLINEEGGLIYSNDDMFLNVANNIINKRYATIFANNNLRIQSREFTSSESDSLNLLNSEIETLEAIIDRNEDQTNSLISKKQSRVDLYDLVKINKLENISGDIIAYNKDINISAKDLINERYLSPVDKIVAAPNSENITKDGPDDDNWVFNDHWCGGHNCQDHRWLYIATINENSDSTPAIISSGKDLTINANDIKNDISHIFAKDNITINADTLNNQSLTTLTGKIMSVLGHSFDEIYDVSDYEDTNYQHAYRNHFFSKLDLNNLPTYPSIIKAGKNITINATKDVDNEPVQIGEVDIISNQTPKIVNAINIEDLNDSKTLSLNIQQYLDGPTNQGIFKKSESLTGPVFETRSQFLDQSTFFASNYFYTQIGLDLEDLTKNLERQDTRLIGDQFFQNKILADQLRSLTNNSYNLSQTNSDTNLEIKSLLDNATTEYSRLGLTYNTKLTPQQINNLQENIIWYEITNIDDNLYIIPKIYLTQATTAKLTNKTLASKSSIFANNDITIVTSNGNITNSGTIIAGNENNTDANITLTAYNNIENKNFSTIKAQNDIDITSSNESIINRSTINAKNNLNLTAAKDISNISTISTNAKNLLDDNPLLAYIGNGHSSRNNGNIYSNSIETANLTSGNNTNINTTNDFNNYAANINTTNDLNITAGDDINIETLKLRNRTEQRWGSSKKSWTKITDITKNIGSNITTGANLALSSGDDTLIKGSDINVDGSATINTTGDLNIASAIDSNYKFESSSKKGSFGRRSSSSSTQSSTTNIESNINVSGDINSNSQKNITILASNLTSGGNINLEASQAINIMAGQDTNYKQTTRNKKGTTIIKSSLDIAQDITNVHSDLNAGKNISLTSGTDTNLIGANLTAENNIDINAGDEVMVMAVADESYRYSTSTKRRNMATVAKYTGLSRTLKAADIITDNLAFSTIARTPGGNISSIASGVVNYYQNLAEGDLNSKTSSSITQTKAYKLAQLNAGNNLNVTSNNNIDFIGTDIDAVDAIVTSTSGDVNIANVKDVSYTKDTVEKSKTTFSSLATDSIRNLLLMASSAVTSVQMTQHPDSREQTIEENEAAMSQKSQKQFIGINSMTDETIVASTIDVNNLTINSGQDTIITSSDINTNNNLDINSTNNTTITSDYENDSSFSLAEKKNPNVFAAISNGAIKLIGEVMPDFSFKKPDDKEQLEKTQRENDSLDHNPHSEDISVATNSDNAMINGYTISNNDANEISYDTSLDKRTTKTKTYISSNITSQNDINIDSTNGNNTIIATNLTANNDININALNGQTLITSAVNESFIATSKVDQDYNDISTNYNRGRVSVDSKTSIYEEDSKTNTNTQVSSILTSGNNININTKDDIDILSSNLTSNNQINLASTHGNTNIASNKNTQRSETEIRQGTLTLSAGIGHVAVDAAYAVDDTIKAREELKSAKDNLSNMKKLHSEGKATKTAVDDAKANLAIATLNVTLALLKQAAAAEKAAKSAGTLGFYADAQLIRSGDKTNINSNSSQEIASKLLSTNDVNINSGSSLIDTSLNEVGNSNIKGSLASIDGDINITSFNDTNITALINESSSSTKTKGFTQTTSLGASYGNSETETLINSITAQISQRTGKSDNTNTNYTNTTITANNGNLNITSTNNDTNISGANLAANSINITSGNDLNIESLQNITRSKSKSRSIGIGGGQNSASLSYNSSRSSFNRDWVDNQTSIISQNNLTINTTKNTDLIGALINSNTNNLTINTNTLTYSDIIDQEKQTSSGFGISTNISRGQNARNPNSTNPNQDNAYYPAGSTTLSLQNEGYTREQITRATIGQGIINITNLASQIQDINNLNRDITKSQEITRDTITGALDVSTTIDNRLFAAAVGNDAAQESLANTIKKSIKNSKIAAGLIVDDIQDITRAIDDVYERIVPNGISDPIVRNQVREAIRTAALNGDTQTLRTKITLLTGDSPNNEDLQAIISLQKDRDFGNLLRESFDGDVRDYKQFSDQYFMPVGVAFDGTGNDREIDKPKGEETNVARMFDLYGSERKNVKFDRTYIKGIGTSGGLDNFCLTLGCGITSKQNQANNSIEIITANTKNEKTLFFPIDVMSFSRGATTGSDFINVINNENYYNQGVFTRSHMMFDPVGSYGAPGNNIDVRTDFETPYNFSTPKNVIAIQINALDESRNLFDLQDLRMSNGKVPNPENHIVIDLPGSHSDSGGGYKDKQDIAFYTMGLMISNAESFGIEFNNIPKNQSPSATFLSDINEYERAQSNYSINPTVENKENLDNIHNQIRKEYAHDSSWGFNKIITKDWYKLYNYDIGSDRGVYNPNDIYLNQDNELPRNLINQDN